MTSDNEVSTSASEWIDFFLDLPMNGILEDLFFEGEAEEDERRLSSGTGNGGSLLLPVLGVLLGPLEEPRKKSVKSDVFN